MKQVLKNNIKEKTQGFTLTEVMVTLALFFILASVGLGAYFQYYSFSLINNDVTQTQSLISNTRFKALKNPDGSDYGIHLDNNANEITSFKVPYNPGNSANIIYALEQLTITDISLAPVVGVTKVIIFDAITGKTQNTGSFEIGNGDFTYSFNLNAQGAIE